MAGYTIRATVEQLSSSANIISDNANTVKSEVDKVTGLLNELRGTFLGQRAGKFFNQFDTDSQAMAKWYDTVEAFSAELSAASTNLGAADNG